MRGSTSVLIPAHNEAALLGQTVAAAWRLPGVGQVVVVDDGSVDETTVVAMEAGAQALRLEHNLGKGAALNRAAGLVRGEAVLLLDADLGSTAAEAAKLLAALDAGQAELVIAAFHGGGGGFGLVRSLASWALARRGAANLAAPLSGQRAMSTAVFQRLLPFAPGYGVEVAMTLRALRLGYRVAEVAVDMRHRATGRDLSGFLHRGQQFGDVLLAIWR